ncbi:MAG: transposase [bacterium]
MYNGTYRSVHINDVEVQTLSEVFDQRPLVLGVDVAKKKYKAGLGTRDGTVHRVVNWTHPRETREFVDFIHRLDASQVQLVLEPTGTYQDPLRYLAYEQGWEVKYQATNRVHDAGEVYDGVDSQHDAKACHLLVWLHSQQMSQPWEPESHGHRRLKVLTDRMADLELQFQRHEGRLESKMAKYWPEVGVGWNVVSATMLGVLKEYGGPKGVAEAPDQAAELMRQIGGHFLKDRRIAEVIEWAKQTVGQPMLKEERQMLSQLAEDTDRIRRQQKHLETQLSRLIHTDECFEDVRRLGEEVGDPTASVFRVSVGDFREYGSTDELLKGFGLNLKEKSSGEHQGLLRITKRGPSEARRFLYLATLRKISRNPIFRAKHDKKVNKDGENEKQKSVVALMRKYVMGLWHVPRGRQFDSHQLFDVSRLNVT